MAATKNLARLEIFLQGVVQGVGLRPQIYRLAARLNLTGQVKNLGGQVLIQIQGVLASDFMPALLKELPKPARISKIKISEIPLKFGEQDFVIAPSARAAVKSLAPPDSAICELCLAELFSPHSNYYLYPFVNCPQCGPRFSIISALPYDRPATSMGAFPLCVACQQVYAEPENRRYHAEVLACAKCGPQLSTTIADLVACLRAGEIIALKALGGYQLICDARNAAAVAKLRQRKQREAKPWALMVLNIPSAEQLVELNAAECELLSSAERPIVLLRKRAVPLPENLAPCLNELGIMLPYTGLHYLIFHGLANFPAGSQWLTERQETVLVVTSANIASEPLVADDQLAVEKLGLLADKIVSHNRQIVAPCDDSVLRVVADAPIFLRRARGYVPQQIKLKGKFTSTLALGANLKNTFCLLQQQAAWVSPHIGSLDNAASLDFLQQNLAHYCRLLNFRPQRIACDLHPDFYTTQLAESWGLPVYQIQHHHAHLAAVLAEHQLNAPVLGLALDGYGYGMQAESWGGELFYLTGTLAERLGSLTPLPQVGGEQALRQPWRMAVSVLHLLGEEQLALEKFSHQAQVQQVQACLKKNLGVNSTSSCGRLFDAASALLGITENNTYEGQAAMQLESLVTEPKITRAGWKLENGNLNLLATLQELINLDKVSGANIFHGNLLAGLTAWIKNSAEQKSVQQVVLSGGCFLNKILLTGLISSLKNCGLTVYWPQQVPPHDGGLSLGQAWLAGQG